MPRIGKCGQAGRFVGGMAGAGLLAVVAITDVNAKDTAGEAGQVEDALTIVAPGDDETTVASEGGGDRERELFSDGPRETGVLSAAGSLTGSDAAEREPRAERDAVAALVAALGAGGAVSTPNSDVGDNLEESAEARGGSPSLLERLGGILGLGED